VYEHVDAAADTDGHGEQQQLGVDAHDYRRSAGERAHPIGEPLCGFNGNVEMGRRTERLLLFGAATED
jgi:hypothetical protein